MWSKIWQVIRSIVSKMMNSTTVGQVLGINPTISNKMEKAIQLWDSMYRNEADWLHEPTTGDPVKIVSLGLPAFIASEKARTATIEMESVITDKNSTVASQDVEMSDKFVPATRAEYLNKMYQLHLIPHIRQQLEYGIAKGGLVIKPYVDTNSGDIRFTFCQADEFYPISFDPTGHMTEAAFTESFTEKNTRYTRVEYHKLNPAERTVTVVNRAFKSIYRNSEPNQNDLGSEVPLTDVLPWANVSPEVTINNVDRLLFAYFKMPEANTIDPKSPIGVSGYSRAVGLIREADLQFSRLVWEYDGGQLAVDVDRDALKTTEVYRDGKPELVEAPNILQGRLFRKVDLGTDETYEVFNPNLRDSNYISGLNSILQRIEDVTGISRGCLSDITRSEAKTATEMLILRQRSFATNKDIQKALQAALEDSIYVMNVLATLYNLAPEGEYQVSYQWDDSLINSPEEELQRRLTLANIGVESKVNIRMWYYGETEEQAMAQLQRINEEALANAQLQAIATGLVQQATPQPEGGQEEEKSGTDKNVGSKEREKNKGE